MATKTKTKVFRTKEEHDDARRAAWARYVIEKRAVDDERTAEKKQAAEDEARALAESRKVRDAAYKSSDLMEKRAKAIHDAAYHEYTTVEQDHHARARAKTAQSELKRKMRMDEAWLAFEMLDVGSRRVRKA